MRAELPRCEANSFLVPSSTVPPELTLPKSHRTGGLCLPRQRQPSLSPTESLSGLSSNCPRDAQPALLGGEEGTGRLSSPRRLRSPCYVTAGVRPTGVPPQLPPESARLERPPRGWLPCWGNREAGFWPEAGPFPPLRARRWQGERREANTDVSGRKTNFTHYCEEISRWERPGPPPRGGRGGGPGEDGEGAVASPGSARSRLTGTLVCPQGCLFHTGLSVLPRPPGSVTLSPLRGKQ